MLIHGQVPALPEDIWKALSFEKSCAMTRASKGVPKLNNHDRKSLLLTYQLEQLQTYAADLEAKRSRFSLTDPNEIIPVMNTGYFGNNTPKRGRGRPVSINNCSI